MPSGLYNTAKEKIANPNLSGAINLLSDTIKVMIVKNTYVFDPDHDFVSDISSHELNVTGYTGGFSGSGRHTLAGKTTTRNDSADRVEFDASDESWVALGAGQTIGGLIIYKHITNDASSQLITFLDIPDVATNGNDFNVTWAVNGLINF